MGAHMLRVAGRFVLDRLYPPSCLLCGVDTVQVGLVCGACFVRLPLLGPPCCKACAQPQASSALLGADGLCATCERRHPAWDQGRAAFVYDAAARDMILRLKYADQLDYAAFLAKHMARAGQDILEPGALVVPVPVHRWRLLSRRYNQAALLSRHVAREQGMEHGPDVLERLRATVRLARFSRGARRREMQGVMQVRARWRGLLPGRTVVLVDDMLTTGATATACVQALREAGAQKVHLLVAGVVPERPGLDIDLPEML
ncbi:MAG: ComF family protein [Acetobacter papayae]